MPLFLDPRGRSTYGIGVCARCSRKFFLDELHPDPNAPGLRVCLEDLDKLDPYRLPARSADRLTLPFVRPDVSVATSYSGAAPINLAAMPIFSITGIGPARPWQPSTIYSPGDSITPLSVDLDTTPLPQNWWFCLLGGTSGASPPDWPTAPGVILGDFEMLTSDPAGLINLLNDARVLNLSDDAITQLLVADPPDIASVIDNDAETDILESDDALILTDKTPSPILLNVLNLLSDNGLSLFADGNGDGTVTWLCLGIYPN